MNQRLKKAAVRSLLIQAMCEYGDLIRVAEDFYEDMGGHMLHESNLDYHIVDFLNNMDPDERNQLIAEISEECS